MPERPNEPPFNSERDTAPADDRGGSSERSSRTGKDPDTTPSACGHAVIEFKDGRLTCWQCHHDLQVVSRDGPEFKDWTFREVEHG